MSSQAKTNAKKLDRISRNLTSILRHRALELGLTMDAAGYIPLTSILQLNDFKGINLADIQQLVAECKKQRFALQDREGDEWFIRANQGHTIQGVIDQDELLTPITNPTDYPIVVHGTYKDAWTLIQESGGLNRMERNHIHFATGLPGADGVISGMRSSSQVLLYINLAAAIADGIQFFISQNGVILTPGDQTGTLPLKYITRTVLC
jgi:2'-phosphotransferase